MSQKDKLYFEDFLPGQKHTLPKQKMLKEDIIEFAQEFDPQPMHLDEKMAEQTMLGGLAASGWQSCAITMRMLIEGFLKNSACLGSPAVQEVKWLLPVRPDDILSGEATVIDSRLSTSRPDMGIIRFHVDVFNQLGDHVLEMIIPIMMHSNTSKGAA